MSARIWNGEGPILADTSAWIVARRLPTAREMLLGDHATLAQRAAYSCERLVKQDTAPMFLAVAADDPDVSVENTLEMFAALRRAHVPAEMHVFERGGHGFGLGDPAQPLSAWPDLLLKWIGARPPLHL